MPNGLTATYYKSFAPRFGVAWSPQGESAIARRLFGGPGRASIRPGWGMFYNPIEQLIMTQFSAEPPFGGSVRVLRAQFGLEVSEHQNGAERRPVYRLAANRIQDSIECSILRLWDRTAQCIPIPS